MSPTFHHGIFLQDEDWSLVEYQDGLTSHIQNHFIPHLPDKNFLKSCWFDFIKVPSVQLRYYYLWLEALCWIPTSPHSSLFDMYQHRTQAPSFGTERQSISNFTKNPNIRDRVHRNENFVEINPL